MSIRNSSLAAGLFILLCSSTFSFASEPWYTEDQRARGDVLFQSNCQVCHGKAGVATQDWRKRDANGNLPPPPLNGTAHTWHHSPAVLIKTMQEGGSKLGGTMPGFADKLSLEDMVAIVGYLNSLWPDEIYSRWLERFPEVKDIGTAAQNAQTSNASTQEQNTGNLGSSQNDDPITGFLKERLPNSVVGAPGETPVTGIFSVVSDGRILYLDQSGRYALTGDLIDLKTGENITEIQRAGMRMEQLSGFRNVDKVIYPAVGAEKAALDIFTDTTCPYCAKLHLEVPKLQQAGVTVRYLPFPRNGTSGDAYNEMLTVWCADDRAEAMTYAKATPGTQIGNTQCDAVDAVDRGYQLARQVGVNGTPAIFLPNGQLIPGYQPWQRLLETLGIGG